MVKTLKWAGIILLMIFLTIISQVGGLVYLLSRIAYPFVNRTFSGKWLRFAAKFFCFAGLYVLAGCFIVPIVAKPFGRVPLPMTQKNNLKPLTIFTCLLNRHYATPALYQTTSDVAQKMAVEFPGMTISYMDACFPFINGFPLLPHLSHNDGKKLDLAFCYTDTKTGKPANRAPTRIGYGTSENPLPGETNMPEQCARKGYWQYGILTKILPQGDTSRYMFDGKSTRTLIQLLAAQPKVGKIFIEPHLQSRMKLTSDKIRFHGCQSVRHDDHIHFQLK